MMFIWYILIGIVAGWLAGKIVRGGGMGLLVNLIVGIIGGVLVTATVGAIVLLAIVSLLSKRSS